MKTFKKFITEELTPEQKNDVDSWAMPTKKTLSHTDHYFGEGNHDIEYPLEGTQDKSEVHKRVEEHLGATISPEEYKGGMTKDKHGRSVRIGGLLTKTKANQDLINDFANDTTRQGKKYTGMTVHVSRHPHRVAGQTSGGQSWENESCKNFENGCNRDYLENEVEEGTVVGYLKDHTGKEIARTTFHPYHNEEGHTMHAINSHYGIRHQGFMDEMSKVADKLSGKHKGGNVLYTINPSVYNDNAPTQKIHPAVGEKDLTNILNQKLPENSTGSEEAKHYRIKKAALNHPKATSEHVGIALNDPDEQLRLTAATHDKITPEQISHVVKNDRSVAVRKQALYNSNTPKEVLDNIMNDKWGDRNLRNVALLHTNLDSKHITNILSNKDKHSEADYDDKMVVMRNPNITSHHIDTALDDRNVEVRQKAIRSPHSSPANIDKALNDHSVEVRKDAAVHRGASVENAQKAINDTSDDVRAAAVYRQHEKLTNNDVDKLVSDPSSKVRFQVVDAVKNLAPHHIDKLLSDSEPSIREHAIMHKNATKEHMLKGLDNPLLPVRVFAGKSPLLKGDDLEKAVTHPDHETRFNAALNPNLSSKHVDMMLRNPENGTTIKTRALSSSHASVDNLMTALDDKHDDLSDVVAKHENANSDVIDKMLSVPTHMRVNRAMHSQHFKDKHMDTAVDHVMNMNDRASNFVMSPSAITDPRLKAHHLSKLLNHSNPAIRRNVASYGNINKEHINAILNHPDPGVKSSVFGNPMARLHLTDAHFEKALSDEHPIVVTNALSHRQVPMHMVSKFINHPNEAIKKQALLTTAYDIARKNKDASS